LAEQWLRFMEETHMPKPFGVAFSILLATGMLIGACWLWTASQPRLGQRPFETAWVCGIRCASAAVWLLGHAVLAGVALPLIYRPRPFYSGAALCSGGVGVLSAVAAAGLLLASR
jgi:hypothetical protein